MVEKINSMLIKIGSDFRTEDGLTLTKYIGHMTYLQKHFNSTTECYNFVSSIYNN